MNLTAFASCLQALFSTRADELAAAAGFIKAGSRFTGSGFLRALASVWNVRPDASYERLGLALGIRKQSLFNRFNPRAVAFCRALLDEAVAAFVRGAPAADKLLDAFDAVYLDDCTQLRLPAACADEFPGCGSSYEGAGEAGFKVFTRFELRRGGLARMDIRPAKTHDAVFADAAPELPAGSLHLADMGFVDLDAMRTEMGRGVFRISRLPASVVVRPPGGKKNVPLSEFLAARRQAGETTIDVPEIRVGGVKNAEGRLYASVCPPDVVEKRLRRANETAKRKGRKVSEAQKEMCRWLVLFGNVPASKLSGEDLWRVYRLRWQIELLFKRFKSHGGLRASTSEKPDRVKCEWYVKLLMQVAKNAVRVRACGPLRDVNQSLATEVVDDFFAEILRAAKGSARAMRRVLREVWEALKVLGPRTKRRKNKPVAQAFAATARAA